MNKVSKVPCRDCEDRKERCHSVCKRYEQFNNEMKKVRKLREIDAIYQSAKFRPNK